MAFRSKRKISFFIINSSCTQEASSKTKKIHFVRLNDDFTHYNVPTELEEQEDLDEDMSDGGEENDGGNEKIQSLAKQYSLRRLFRKQKVVLHSNLWNRRFFNTNI
jgi:hypothetical protein